ncbi:amidase [Jannaschia sp. M317]|nr:amidase [Jannaschia sp. M317]
MDRRSGSDIGHRFQQKAALWEPHIHAFATISDPAQIGSPAAVGPLAGLMVGVKDIIDVAGLPTCNGSQACRDAVPAPQDAPVVAALRAAGASIVGKTTTTEFAFTDPTACRNPFDLTRSPGGSSSGSGAAVAAGLVDIALGTQTAGSLCRPAAYCGVVGFKPSYGLLSNIGVTPLAPSFDSVGIIAGSLMLVQQACDAMAHTHAAASAEVKPTLLCGLWDGDVVPYDDTLVALDEAADACKAFATSLRKTTLQANVERIVTAHRIVMTFEAAMAHGSMLSDDRADLLMPKFKAGLQAGAAISAAEAAQATAYLADAMAAFWAGLADVDAILTLPVPDGAPLIDGTTGYQDWLTPWTVFGGPLVCLPWGLDRLGRPRSVMLAGKPGQDALLLSMAAELEAQSPPRAIPQPPRT